MRPSWENYQYALQAMDNQEWNQARRYLNRSLRNLVTEPRTKASLPTALPS